MDGHASGVQEPQLTAERDELRADLTDGPAVILAEIGNRLLIRSQVSGEPHQLNIAAGRALQSAARLHPVEVAVDV